MNCTTNSRLVWWRGALKLGLVLAAGAIAVAALASCTGEPKSAEAAYAAAARKAVERAKSLKKDADVAVAAADKTAIKEAADDLQVQYVALKDVDPPPQFVEFHTTVVQQVFVIYDTAQTIVVQDLPPEEARSSWEEASAAWDIWLEQVWDVWVEEVSRIEDPTPEVTVEAEVGDFDGGYQGEATVTVSVSGTTVGPFTVPITFNVEDGEIHQEVGELLTGGIIDQSGTAELTIDLSQFGVAGSLTTEVVFSNPDGGDGVSVEGTISGSVSVEDVAAVVDGAITAERISV